MHHRARYCTSKKTGKRVKMVKKKNGKGKTCGKNATMHYSKSRR